MARPPKPPRDPWPPRGHATLRHVALTAIAWNQYGADICNWNAAVFSGKAQEAAANPAHAVLATLPKALQKALKNPTYIDMLTDKEVARFSKEVVRRSLAHRGARLSDPAIQEALHHAAARDQVAHAVRKGQAAAAKRLAASQATTRLGQAKLFVQSIMAEVRKIIDKLIPAPKAPRLPIRDIIRHPSGKGAAGLAGLAWMLLELFMRISKARARARDPWLDVAAAFKRNAKDWTAWLKAREREHQASIQWTWEYPLLIVPPTYKLLTKRLGERVVTPTRPERAKFGTRPRP